MRYEAHYPPIDPEIGTTRPRRAQGEAAGKAALVRAQSFVCLVRDESVDGIGAWLDRLTRDALYGVTVALAAMVPVDQSAHDLLAWLPIPAADHDDTATHHRQERPRP